MREWTRSLCIWFRMCLYFISTEWFTIAKGVLGVLKDKCVLGVGRSIRSTGARLLLPGRCMHKRCSLRHELLFSFFSLERTADSHFVLVSHLGSHMAVCCCSSDAWATSSAVALCSSSAPAGSPFGTHPPFPQALSLTDTSSLQHLVPSTGASQPPSRPTTPPSSSSSRCSGSAPPRTRPRGSDCSRRTSRRGRGATRRSACSARGSPSGSSSGSSSAGSSPRAARPGARSSTSRPGLACSSRPSAGSRSARRRRRRSTRRASIGEARC